MIKFGSLFTGIGGFDLAFERAGMECIWQVEKDKYCNQVLENRYPSIRRFEDVKKVGKENLEAVDVICGGFPCQDVSIAGSRKGISGERSGLWFEFYRVIKEMRPKWVVVENVAGLLSSNKGRDFATILQGLVKCRYSVCWRVLDSQYFGVAQRRRRLFIVASFRNGNSAKVLLEPQGLHGDIRQGKETRRRIANTTADGFEKNDRISIFQNKQSSNELRQYENISPTMIKRWGTGGNNVPFVYTFLDDNSIGLRKLTPTECCRLQGFPDDWNVMVSDTQRYQQLGNAVTVNVAEWIGKRIVNNHGR